MNQLVKPTGVVRSHRSDRLPKSADPVISVLMSVRDCEPFVAQAIQSILDQSFTDFELILVDDFSGDGTAQICQRFSLADQRIKFLRNKEHLGLTRSLNKALAIANGKYVARMDADDISLPDRFEEQIQYLESHPGVGLIGSQYHEIDKDGHVVTDVIQFSDVPIIVHWRMAFENPIPHPPIMVRKDLLDVVGGYDERWRTSQDYDLFTRLAGRTKMTNYPGVLFHWRRHNRSTSWSENEAQRLNALQICRTFLSDLLQRDVSEESVHLLWDRKIKSAEHAQILCRIGLEVATSILRQPRWSHSEKTNLRRYVLQKLFYYMRPYSGARGLWPEFMRLAFLAPVCFLGLSVSKFIGRSES